MKPTGTSSFKTIRLDGERPSPKDASSLVVASVAAAWTYTPSMDHRRTWGSLAVPIVVALVALAVVDWQVVSSGRIVPTVGPAATGPLAGYLVVGQPEPAGDWFSFVARFIVGASVVVAVAHAFRIRAVRLDLVAFVVWTVVFVWVTSNPNVALPDYVCRPGPGQSIPPSLGTCYQPWVPGLPRMAVWFLASAAILLTGSLLRRWRSATSRPVAV